jgi:hypothetical protein
MTTEISTWIINRLHPKGGNAEESDVRSRQSMFTPEHSTARLNPSFAQRLRYCRILGLNAEYSKSVRKFTST